MRLPFAVHLPDRRRAASFVLALVVEALLILLLLLFGPHFTPIPKPKRLPTSFSLSPDNADRAATSPERHKARAAAKPATGNPPPLTPPIPPIPPPPKAQTNPIQLKGVLPIQLGDISKIKSSAPADSDAGDSSADSKAAYGPSEGPGGVALYPAEWYRRPTDAELGGFLTKPPPSGSWALIACRTIANYHVDNCRQLGESPLGSGLARSMRQAAWQFLVRPPRKGGKPMVGAWVSIRIDFHTVYIKGKSPDGDESDDDKPAADK